MKRRAVEGYFGKFLGRKYFCEFVKIKIKNHHDDVRTRCLEEGQRGPGLKSVNCLSPFADTWACHTPRPSKISLKKQDPLFIFSPDSFYFFGLFLSFPFPTYFPTLFVLTTRF
jgi:hypothetical protein